MSIVSTTRAAPAGSANNTLTSASMLAPTGQLILVVGFQGCSTINAAALGISTSIAGLAFTKVAGTQFNTSGGRTVCIALWRALGNGNSGTVTVSNAALGTQSTDLRAYSFAGAKELDPLVGSVLGGDGSGAVVSTLEADAVNPHNFDLDSGVFSPWGNSLQYGFLIGIDGTTPIIWDTRLGWEQVDHWDSNASFPTTLQVIRQLGNVANQVDGNYQFKFMLSSGDTAGSAFIGAGIRDATQKVSKNHLSRGARITASRF